MSQLAGKTVLLNQLNTVLIRQIYQLTLFNICHCGCARAVLGNNKQAAVFILRITITQRPVNLLKQSKFPCLILLKALTG